MVVVPPPVLPCRAIVVWTWGGSRVVQQLGPSDPDPSPEELAAIEAQWSAGGQARVRVLEVATVPGRWLGAAGTVPRGH